MKKTLIAAALMALVATGASAKTATDSAAIAKNKPVFTVVKENLSPASRIRTAVVRAGLTLLSAILRARF